ncbi:MAG: haloacid dehalogenase [bacterium]
MTNSYDISKELDRIIEDLRGHFDAVDSEREEIYAHARELRRLSTRAIREAHKGSPQNAENALSDLRELAAKITDTFRRYPFVEEALQEYSEASLFLAFLMGKKIPTARDLATTERGYLLGLADCVGELRRHVLYLISRDRLDEAAGLVDLMEEIFYLLMKFDHPDGVIPIRHKQDQLRPIVERTRAEFTMIQCQKRLENKLTGHDFSSK